MILARAQSDRLFRILTCLKAFAAARYDMASPQEVMMMSLGKGSDELESALLRTLWADPDAIGDLLATRPASLSPAEVSDIKGFADHVSGMVLAVGTDESGRGLFLVEARLVAVVGVTRQMSELVPGPYPRPVELTLLPFEGVVTYDGFVNEYPMSYGPGLRAAMKKEMDEALTQEPITGAAEFAEYAREVAEIRRDREEQRFAEQLQHDEWEANGNDPLAPDVHRGVLAGLSEEQRAARIEQEMANEREKSNVRRDYVADLRKRAVKGEPHLRFIDSLIDAKKAELERYAYLLDVPNRSKLRKSELAELVAPELLSDDSLMVRDLINCFDNKIAAFKELALSDGVVRFSPEEARGNPGRYRENNPWTRLYWTGEEFALAMPDEVRELAAGLDYDDLAARARSARHVEHFAEVLTEFCGVVSMDTFCERFRGLYGTEQTKEEVVGTFYRLWEDYGEGGSYSFWRDPASSGGEEITYLIDYRLSNTFISRGIVGERARELGSERRGELASEASLKALEKQEREELEERDRLVRYLIERHEQVASEGPCPLDPALAEKDVLRWKRELPAAINLRNWLDAHVPDDDSDLYFADRMIEELTDAQTMVSGPTQFLQEASDLGITVLSDDVDAIVGRLTAFWNAMPSWESDGWSPDALAEKRGGKKIFRNPDGSPMKVGRNDPCPCGSGKKYKRCCGR
ncbi:SEC-C metal-binding domain-containing protein [Paratractidigestivibacter sp.]|uniref:SEC-C metal-binding domain-containing protein n=1 Tax=Paratractidigestivibacter sp. TaxID=2847316 RepID=UPI002AC8E250|nr:SEC-C metal-binding domain-containing protein [Paratractidigestivibacter sp.]